MYSSNWKRSLNTVSENSMVYWVLACSLLDINRAILETNDMGLIFQQKKKNGKKVKNGIKEETG